MAILEPEFAVLDETDSGLDIDALKVVAHGVQEVRSDTTGLGSSTGTGTGGPATGTPGETTDGGGQSTTGGTTSSITLRAMKGRRP